MCLRAVLANVLRACGVKAGPSRSNAPSALSVGAGLVSRGLELGNAVLQHGIGEIGNAVLDRVIEPLELFWSHALRQQNGRELGVKKNFIGIGIADAAEQVRISQRALERVIGGGKRGAELIERSCKDIDAARIECG